MRVAQWTLFYVRKNGFCRLTNGKTYLLTYLLTYPTEQSHSCEPNRFSVTLKNLHLFWNPKVHYRLYKCPNPVHFLRQMNPVYPPTSHFLNIHPIIILPSTPRTSKWSSTFRWTQWLASYRVSIKWPNLIYCKMFDILCCMLAVRHFGLES
jgi:hypothetical protein